MLLCLHKHHHLSRFPPVPQIGEMRDKPIVSYLGDFVVIYCKMEETKPEPRTWIWYKANGTEKVSCSEPVQLCHWSFLIDIPSSRISYVHLPCFYSQEYSSRAALHVTHVEIILIYLIYLNYLIIYPNKASIFNSSAYFVKVKVDLLITVHRWMVYPFIHIPHVWSFSA